MVRSGIRILYTNKKDSSKRSAGRMKNEVIVIDQRQGCLECESGCAQSSCDTNHVDHD